MVPPSPDAPPLIVYAHRESGHSYKVLLALTLAGRAHEVRIVDLALPRDERRADFRAASPYGEVPVLIDGDAPPLAQSDAILLHLARAHGILAAGDGDRLTQWLFWEANRVGLSVPNLRWYRRFEAGPPEVVAWLEGRARADLARLDAELVAKPFLLGDQVTICDVACSAYLFWPEQAGLALSTWPNVEAWLDRIRRLPGWKHPYDLVSAADSHDRTPIS